MEHYTQAWECFLKQRWKEARFLLKQEMAQSGEQARSFHLLGVVLYQEGRFKAGLKNLKQACEMESNAEYFLNFSIVLNEMGHYPEGAVFYEKALKLQKQSAFQNWKEEVTRLHIQTAQTYLKQNHREQALKQYLSALELKPEDVLTQLEVARLLWDLKHREKALKHLKEIVSLSPRLTEARLLLARWLFIQKQSPLAIQEWEKILKLHPDNKEAKEALLKIQYFTEPHP